MTITVELLSPAAWADAPDGLQHYAALPDWLTAAIAPNRVIAALARTAPDFAPGGLTIRSCKIKHVGLDDALGAWTGEYNLTVERAESEPRTVLVHGVFSAPGTAEPDAGSTTTPQAFGELGWRCYLPELGLELRAVAPEPELPALPALTDPEQARALLEASIRAGAPAYHDIQIQACEPLMMRSRAGVRHVLRYRLSYAPELAATHTWPALVVAKTYDSDIGQNAYTAMRALWESPLGTSANVTIAEALAYVPDPKVLVQGPIQEEQTLEEMVENAFSTGDQAALDELAIVMRKAAIGLAELHRSGVGYGRTFTWRDRLAQAREALDGLAVPLPLLGEAGEHMFAQLEAIAAAEPVDRTGPAHGAFRAAQVLIHQGKIGFIDFDGFCQAEPAMDLARFLATTKDVALDAQFGKEKGADDPATAQRRNKTLDQIEALCETFLQQYEQLAPISRTRVALWETLNIFTLVMSCWKKVKPARLKNTLLMLERQLNASYTGHPAPTVQAQPGELVAGLRRLAVLPSWLLAPLQADHIGAALRERVPEFASGALELRSCKIKRMLLKDATGRWVGTYTVTVAGPDGKRPILLRGSFTPPNLRQSEDAGSSSSALPFGADGWRLALPELGLELEIEPPETELAAMPRLTDPQESRALLEQGIRADSPAYANMQITACTPEVLSYKPGSRCTLRYHLSYPPALADRGWPASVIAKTYRKDSKGRNAYDGMLALWRSPLVSGDVVTLAEPLAYIPELKIMVQGPIAGAQSLEDMLKAALAANSQPAIEELYGYMRKTAVALAAFHQSGVRHGQPVELDARFAEIRDLIARLLIPAPELADTVEPLLMRLEALAADHPADAAVPTHGTFNPEQVLIDGERIGLIDFDDFCMAEPALDVALFRAAIKDIGMNALDESMARNREIRLARLARLDMIADIFLAEYQQHAPITRARVALWEAWSYLRDALHFWTKVKPAEPDNGLLMLESHLRGMGLDPAAPAGKAAKQPRRSATTPAYRSIALAYAVIASTWVDDLVEVLGFLQSMM